MIKHSNASFPIARAAALALIVASLPLAAEADAPLRGQAESASAVSSGKTSSFEDVLNANASNAKQEVRLTPVREAALRDAALTLGVQWGLGDRSREIVAEYEKLSTRLDAKYQFGALMMGVGFLPPVISEARNAVSIDTLAMRVANRVWSIDEPARPVIVPPTWRDWLYLGLQPDLRPAAPTSAAVLPRDDAEKTFWQQTMKTGYEQGRKQAMDIFTLNLARLDRTYDGMRRFYDLFKAGKVTAPVIASATSIIDREDPNTVVVGNTVFRIVAPTRFVTDTEQWKPLAK